MPVANSTANNISSLPKWQLALAVGAPVALGLGYMYYKNSNQGKKKGYGKANGSAEKQISIDGDSSGKSSLSEKTETPEARALRYKTLGNTSFSASKYDEAIAYYNKAIEACSSNKEELAKNYQNRAAAYNALKNFSAVIDDCTKALELNPKYTKAMLRRAKMLEETNELELALEDATAACMVDRFTNPTSLTAADRILKKLGKQHAEEHRKNNKTIMPSRHYIKAYFSSFKNDPILLMNTEDLSKDENKHLARAVQAFKNENYDKIIDICTEEIDSCGEEDLQSKMKLLLLRATFQLLLGEHEIALEDLGVIIDNEKSEEAVRVNALIKRATMFLQTEKRDECFEDFEKAVSIYPECGDVYHHRGQVNLLLDRIVEAKSDSKKALDLNPNFGFAYAQKCYTDYRFAAVQRSPSMIDEAVNAFDKAFELFPDCCECYTLYAQMLCDSQLFEKADEYFVKALEMDSKNATIHVHRGLVHLQWTGDIDKAVGMINKALEVDDKCEFAYETLGTIEVQRGNNDKAIKLFDKALALARTSVELTHIFSLRDAAKAQLKMSERLGSDIMPILQTMS